jgi:hypothetical protein
MKTLRSQLLITLLCLANACVAQTIRGIVIDKTTNQALVGASVVLQNTTQNTTSKDQGEFRFDKLPTGRYAIQVSFVGFQTQLIPDVLVTVGKETVLEINLLAGKTLDELAIKADRIDFAAISSRTFTTEEIQRFAGNYNDPARLVRSYAGVAGTNDQANHFVIRGNTPNNMTWRLDGLDVVNPNHLANGGTFSDRPTVNGGGVSILSMQLLANSKLLTGAFSSEYGNTLAGVMDMRLRKGNNQKKETTLSASVIGIDLATEGPLSKGSKASYLVNYRYSFTGLLSAMGAKLGDEDIRYQDISINLNFPNKKGGGLSVFGMYGTSSNVFDAIKDSQLWKTQQDFSDIDYRSKMGALIVAYDAPLGAKTTLRTALALSQRADDRSQTDYLLQPSTTQLRAKGMDIDNSQKAQTSFTTAITHKISSESSYKFGFFINQYNDKLTIANLASSALPFTNNFTSTLVQPYVQYKTNLNNRLGLNIGLYSASFQTLEPRSAISYQFSEKQTITAAFGLHSQLIRNKLLGKDIVINLASSSLPTTLSGNHFMMAQHYVLAYNRTIRKNLHFKTEAYYQALSNVPVETEYSFGGTGFTKLLTNSNSILNNIEQYSNAFLKAAGTGKNYGVEFSVEQFLAKNWYYVGSLSLYESKYTATDGIERDTRFNGKHLAALTIGKELARNKKGKDKSLGINLKGLYQGGFRESPINFDNSKLNGFTTFDDASAYSLKLPDYYRIDLRLSWKKNRPHSTRTLSLDIQNLSNHQNVAFRYYDTWLNKVVTKYQLGVIPVLGYRVDF